ncbi:MAG: hypothetical protein ACRENP_14790 [Longimicrobiales bacterium]
MPLDRGIIEQQLAALGEPATWWERRELRDLPAVLHAEERIQAIALGKLHRARWRREWLVVVTDERLVCLQTNKRMGRRQFDLHAGQVTDLSVRNGIRRAFVTVRAYGEVYRLRVRRTDAVKLSAAISKLVPTRERPLETRHSPGAMVGRVIQHMLALPSAAFDEVKPPPPVQTVDNTPIEQRLQLLENEVQRLQQQVDFLEDLLQQRSLLVERPHKHLSTQSKE